MFERAPLPRIDSRGKIICEGDVIDLYVPNDGGKKPYTHERQLVWFSEEDCSFQICTRFFRKEILAPIPSQEAFDEFDSRIIGNVYDDPSLRETLESKEIDEKEIPK